MNSEKSQISWNLNSLKQEVPTADLHHRHHFTSYESTWHPGKAAQLTLASGGNGYTQLFSVAS